MLRLSLLVAALGSIVARGASAQSASERAALGAVQRLFDAMKAKDTAGVRAAFEPGARLVGMRTRPDGSTVLQSLTVDQFVGFVGRDTRGPWIERAWSPEVRIDGTLATVWAAYDFHFGTTPSHCGTDAVQLLQVGGDWKIVSIADTFRATGCPERAPPAPNE
jgi:hypothetical protein